MRFKRDWNFYARQESLSNASWRIRTCDMAHGYVLWLLCVNAMTHPWRRVAMQVTWRIYILDMTRPNVCHDAFVYDMAHVYVPWLSYVDAVTHLWHSVAMQVTWLIYIRDMTRPYVCHDVLVYDRAHVYVTWLSHMNAMTQSSHRFAMLITQISWDWFHGTDFMTQFCNGNPYVMTQICDGNPYDTESRHTFVMQAENLCHEICAMKSVAWQSVRHRITTHICDAGFACFGPACIAILCTHALLSQKTQSWHRIAMQATTFWIRTFQIRFQNLSVEGCTHTRDMAHSHMWHDSFTYVPWLMSICQATFMTQSCDPRNPCAWSPIGNFICNRGLTHVCVMTHSHMTWLMYTCHDSFAHDMTHVYVPCLIRTWHDSCIRAMTRVYMPWRIHDTELRSKESMCV